MDLLKLATRRSTVGESIYIILNLVYAGALLTLVLLFTPPWLAYLLVILSKWRTLAVRPRYWFANIQANLVDALVVGSFVTLIWQASGSLWLQVGLAVLMAVWLTVLKPLTKRRWMLIQALVCQIVGLTALFTVAYHAIAIVVVAIGWLVGFSAARHALTAYKEEADRTLLGLVWGFLIAELAWLSYHWTIAYTIYGAIKIPEIVITSGLIGFLAIKIYGAAREDGKKHWARDLRWPAVFVVFIVVTLLVLFNGINPSSL